MVNIIQLLILSFNLIFIHSSSSFYFYQRPSERTCFQEYFADNTLGMSLFILVTFHITANNTITMTIFDPQNVVMLDRQEVTNIKYAFTTFEGGQFSVCVRNVKSEQSNKVDFSMKFGIAAKDYSEIAKKKDLKPVELNVKYT
jgi:hypothetical protein